MSTFIASINPVVGSDHSGILSIARDVINEGVFQRLSENPKLVENGPEFLVALWYRVYAEVQKMSPGKVSWIARHAVAKPKRIADYATSIEPTYIADITGFRTLVPEDLPCMIPEVEETFILDKSGPETDRIHAALAIIEVARDYLLQDGYQAQAREICAEVMTG